MIKPSELSRQQLLERLQQLLEEERQLVVRLREADSSNQTPTGTLTKQRRGVWDELRGSVKSYGDIISPIDVEWDAAR